MNRRDILLQQMGISQWQLRRPDVLKGAVNIPVASHIRLIIIADELNAQDKLLQDILFSAELTTADCLMINFSQAPHLHVQHSLHYWLLDNNAEKITHSVALCVNAKGIWQTPDLASLKHNATAKRQLWQQIQSHYIE